MNLTAVKKLVEAFPPHKLQSVLSATDESNKTPVWNAASAGDFPVLKYLIDQRVSTKIRANDYNYETSQDDMSAPLGFGSTLVQIAVCKGHTKCVELLLMQKHKMDKENLIRLAVLSGQVNVLKLLTQDKTLVFYAQMHAAIRLDGHENLEYLISCIEKGGEKPPSKPFL